MEPLLLQVPDDLTHQGTLYTVQLDSNNPMLQIGHGQDAGCALLLDGTGINSRSFSASFQIPLELYFRHLLHFSVLVYGFFF